MVLSGRWSSGPCPFRSHDKKRGGPEGRRVDSAYAYGWQRRAYIRCISLSVLRYQLYQFGGQYFWAPATLMV